MSDDLTRLLEVALEREKASRELYNDSVDKTDDKSAQVMLKELADEEETHIKYLEKIRLGGLTGQRWKHEKVRDLMISRFLDRGEKLQGAGLQDTLIYAIKHEQHSIDFYSRLMSTSKNKDIKKTFEGLVQQELKHKLNLEILYDDIFLAED